MMIYLSFNCCCFEGGAAVVAEGVDAVSGAQVQNSSKS